MSDPAIYIDGVRYVPTRVAAKDAGLSQNYIAKICKLGFTGAKLIRGIWYVDVTALRAYLLSQAEERAKWQSKLSLDRRAEHAHLVRPQTGAAAITIHPRQLHEYREDLRRKKKLRKDAVLASFLFLFIATSTYTTTFNIAPRISNNTASVADIFDKITSVFSGIKDSILPKPKIIYVGVMSPTIVNDLKNQPTPEGSAEKSANQAAAVYTTNAEMRVDSYSKKTRLYSYRFDLASSTAGLLNFAVDADIGDLMQNLSVFLTPSFDGRVFYAVDPTHRSITVFSSARGLISVQFIAPKKIRTVQKTNGTSTIPSLPSQRTSTMPQGTSTMPQGTSTLRSEQ